MCYIFRILIIQDICSPMYMYVLHISNSNNSGRLFTYVLYVLHISNSNNSGNLFTYVYVCVTYFCSIYRITRSLEYLLHLWDVIIELHIGWMYTYLSLVSLVYTVRILGEKHEYNTICQEIDFI